MPRALFPWLAPEAVVEAELRPTPVVERKLEEVEPEPAPISEPPPAFTREQRLELIRQRHRVYLERRAEELAEGADDVDEDETSEAVGILDAFAASAEEEQAYEETVAVETEDAVLPDVGEVAGEDD